MGRHLLKFVIAVFIFCFFVLLLFFVLFVFVFFKKISTNMLNFKDLPGSTEDRETATAAPPQTSTADHTHAHDASSGEAKEKTKTFSLRPGVGGGGQEKEGGTDTPMSIAWRYQSKPKVQSLSFSNQFGHFYDLTVKMPTARVEAVRRVHFNALDNHFR